MKNYILNYMIILVMLGTSIMMLTSKKLRSDEALVIFAIIWMIIAIIYTIITTRSCLIELNHGEKKT